MNFYRSGGDIGASFDDILNKVLSTLDFNDRPSPASYPGCWAYPDMSEIGNWAPGPLRLEEERSHWGLWAIVSSPLILGFDMSNKEAMDRVWPIITNTDALAVNHAWAGRPGTLIRSYPAHGEGLQAQQGPCDGSPGSLGWGLSGGFLQAPNPAGLPGPQCVLLANTPNCPPPTLHDTSPQCGLLLGNCSSPSALRNLSQISRGDPLSLAPGRWSYNATSRRVLWQDGNPKDKPKCLSASPLNFDVTKGYYVRQNAMVQLADCPPADKPTNATTFSFGGKGELRSGDGVCLRAGPVTGPQLWSKPLPDAKAAVLLLNPAPRPQDVSVPLADVPHLACGGPCTVRDVWAQKDSAPVADRLELRLGGHASAFYVLGPSKSIVSWI